MPPGEAAGELLTSHSAVCVLVPAPGVHCTLAIRTPFGNSNDTQPTRLLPG